MTHSILIFLMFTSPGFTGTPQPNLTEHSKSPTWGLADIEKGHGFLLDDFLVNGTTQILTAGLYYWQIHQRVGNDYRVVHLSERYLDRTLVSVTRCHNQGSEPQLVVCHQTEASDGFTYALDFHDYGTFDKTRTVTLTSTSRVYEFQMHDLDGDGTSEILAKLNHDLLVFSGQAPHEVLYRVNEVTRQNEPMVVGNVDEDPDLEIVLTGSQGNPGYILNGPTGAIELERSFGPQIALVDVNGDGVQNILYAEDHSLTCWDAVTRQFLWTHFISSGFYHSITGVDVPNSGRHDVMFYKNGTLVLLNGMTGDTRWSIEDVSVPSPVMMAGKVAGTGRDDLVLYSDRLKVFDLQTRQMTWSATGDDGGRAALDLTDLDGDNVPEILTASEYNHDHPEEDGVIRYLDAATKTVKFQIDDLPQVENKLIKTTLAGDVTGDGVDDLVVLYTHHVIQIYDGADFQLIHTIEDDDFLSIDAIALGDTNRTGAQELVMIRQKPGPFEYPDTEVAIYGGSTMYERWHTFVSSESTTNLALFDVDDDNAEEIFVMDHFSGVAVYDGLTHTLRADINDHNLAVTFHDWDGDGVKEMIMGGRRYGDDSYLRVYRTSDWTEIATASFSIDVWADMQFKDLNDDGVLELITLSDELSIYDVGTGEEKWSVPLLRYYGQDFSNHMFIKDLDNNGRQDILIGDRQGLWNYEPIICSNLAFTLEGGNVSGCLDQPIVLSVAAEGSDPSYQWFHQGLPLAGEVNATLAFTPTSLDQAGAYTCVVTDFCGSAVESAASMVTLTVGPQITQQPDDQAVCRGETVSFQASVTGANPSYQWYHNGLVLVGQTQAVLDLGSVDAADAGTYTLEVADDCGVITTEGAELTVSWCQLTQAWETWRHDTLRFCNQTDTNILAFTAAVNNGGGCTDAPTP